MNRFNSNILCLCAIPAIVLCVSQLKPGWAGQIDVIAVNGQQAPDENGILSLLGVPTLNNQGQVAFHSTLSGTSGGNHENSGIFRGGGGEVLTQIARKGQTAPDGNGQYCGFDSPALNDAGQVAFFAPLINTIRGSDDNEGIFREPGGTVIVRRGQSVPDGNGFFYEVGEIGYVNYSFNDVGHVAFNPGLTGTTGPYGNRGVFLSTGSDTLQIARGGDTAPDGNGTYRQFSDPSLNDHGQVAFQAVIQDTNNQGVFRGQQVGAVSQITQIARCGDPAPDGNGNLRFFTEPALNNLGQAAFQAELANTSGGGADNEGIYRGDGTNLIQIVREGQPAPDYNGHFGYIGPNIFSDPALNDRGEVAFIGTLVETNGGGADDRGIFRGEGGPLTQIARAGQTVPDGNGQFDSFVDLAINNIGNIAFTAFLTGVPSRESEVLYYFSDQVGLVEVLREGDALLGSTISGVYLASSTASLGSNRSGLNDLGQVAFKYVLANSRSGVAVWSYGTSSFAGDFDKDGDVDGGDFLVWQASFGIGNGGDADGDNETDDNDLLIWQCQFGSDTGSGLSAIAVPESASVLLLAIVLAVFALSGFQRVLFVRFTKSWLLPHSHRDQSVLHRVGSWAPSAIGHSNPRLQWPVIG
ncbi:MAG: hypothetical protein JW829_11095 [Pirellulales bacterium]|nr:hypothetical protein [Pirellulales bacterium]